MSLNLRHVNDETLVNALDTIRATTIISEFRGAGYLGSNSTPSQEWQTYETQVLDKAYRNNIERIMDETIEPSMPGLAKKIFGVLLTSVRRLTVEELQHAICAIRQSDVPPDFTTTRLYSWEDLQKVCRGMIQADQAGFVVFMHSSLGTYLERSRVFFQDRQSVMAAACLRYLAMDTFSQGICTTVESLEERMNKWPFFPYAARYWGRHINHRIDSSLSGNDFAAQTIKPQKACACDNRCALATEFLGLDRNVESAFQIECLPDRLENQLFRKLCSGHSMDDFLQCLKVVLVITEGSKPEETRSILKRNHKCGLHWACELSCPTMFNELKICKESALDRQDWNGRSPLILAARSGNSAFTSTLLDLGVKPDVADSGGMTALAWASRQGHQLIVDTLLGHRDRVDPNSVDELVRSNWVDSIIPVGKKQLDLDGIVSIASIGGRTPLHHAARNNHIGIVQSLLKDSRTNVNHFDGDGLNVLHRAAKKGHVELVRLFIEHPDIDPARRVCEKTRGVYDKRWNTRHPGKTFLHLASRHQYCQAVVKYAVECHTDLLYTRDDAGQTPLHCAVECGAVVNVKILLEEPSIDPNIQDSSKRTPLHLSVVNARPDVLLELLGHPKTNPDLQDNDGLTPLGVSIRYGNEEAYQSILQYWGHAHWALATTPQIRLTRNFVSKSANLAFVIQPWSKHSPHFVEPSPIYGVAIIGPRA
jgi:ankyrin repeat protein